MLGLFCCAGRIRRGRGAQENLFGLVYINASVCFNGRMSLTVQAILQEHFEAFAKTHPLADYQRAAVRQLSDCRTAAMGGHWESCPQGHVHTPRYNSCHHRSCPLCAGLARERWLEDWKQRLLECPHNHSTFTTPQDLIPLWRYNKQEFSGLLFHAASDTLRELLADAEYLGALPGLLAGLHTWGQQQQIHIHLHVLITWGGLNAEGQWVQPKRRCLLPRKVLMEKFRGKFLAYLRKALDKGKLALPPDLSQAEAQSLLNQLGRAVWNVKIFDPYEHGRGVATYLARYLKGGPLSNGRLVDCRDGVVRFWYRDNRDQDEEEGNGRRKILPLPVDEFLARLLEHVPPPGMQTVRPYGLYAAGKKPQRAAARAQLEQPPEPVDRPKLKWWELCERLGIEVQRVCPVCGAALVSHGEFPRGRFSRQDQPPPPKLPSWDDAPPPVAQPPPSQAA